MSLELCILGSGSAGNCSVLRSPAGTMLVDAGFGPRALAKRLNGTGVTLADVRAVCVTHLDRDHLNLNLVATLVKLDISVWCHRSRVGALLQATDGLATGLAPLIRPFDEVTFEPLPGVAFEPIALAHDRTGSHGFVIEGFGTRIGYATDLGHVPAALLERFARLDVLAIESNYDPHLQQVSGRPYFLQRRIMGGAGHLSNQQALDAVRFIFNRCERTGTRLPSHVVLLHRSRQCNCARLVRELFAGDARIAPRLVLTDQWERTEWLRPVEVAPAPGEQLILQLG